MLSGKTGAGKTYLAKYMTRSLTRLVVLDGKGTLSDWNLDPWSRSSYRDMVRGEPFRVRVLPPVGSNVLEFWDEVLLACYHAGNLTIYIDELYAVNPPNRQPSDALFAVYTRGRELGLGVWASTQRPVWIPLVALSEAEHFFMFRLQLFEDRQRMAAFMGNEVTRTITDRHGFFYMYADNDSPTYIRQLEVKEDGKGKLLKIETPRKKDTEPLKRQKANMGNFRTRRI
jgi:hypothetical protein